MTNKPRSMRLPSWADLLGLGGALLALVVYFSLRTDNFLTVTNFQTIANQIPADLIIATGMTFVLIAGGIDLSVGSVMAVSSAVFGVALAVWGWSLSAALLAGFMTGALCGAINATIVAWWGIPSFIVTLGMLEAARGATYLVTDSQSQYLGERVEWIASASVFGVSLPIFFAVLVVLSAQFTLSYTPFGRHLLAMGQNEEVAWLSGIPTRRIRWMVFCLAGALTGFAALFYTARFATADPNAGKGLELAAIAAVVIGGTSLSGGRGSVLRSAIGVVIIAVLGSGLAQSGAQEPLKRVVTGAVIVVAVILDKLRQKAER